MSEHPVLAKIDRNQPYFDRTIIRHLSGEDRECRLQFWLPVQLDNSGWVAAVRLIGLDMPEIGAPSGADPLDALISALAFARDVIERAEGRFLLGHRELAGLPVCLDRGFYPDVLLELELQADKAADERAAELHGPLFSVLPE